MSLVREWKQAHRITSVQVGAAIAVLGCADQWLPMVQGFIAPWMFGLLGACGVIARLVVQPKLAERVKTDRAIK
jgi:hypothetical protein